MYAPVSLAEGKELVGEFLATGKEKAYPSGPLSIVLCLFQCFYHRSCLEGTQPEKVLGKREGARRRCHYRTMNMKGRKEILINGYWPRWESLSYWSFLESPFEWKTHIESVSSVMVRHTTWGHTKVTELGPPFQGSPNPHKPDN